MKWYQRKAALVVALAFPLAALAQEPQRESDVEAAQRLKRLQSESRLTPEARAVAGSMIDSGLELQRVFAVPHRDVTTSPFSITSAFGLVVNGVRGRTLTDVMRALHLGNLTAAQFNAGYSAVTRGLAAISRENVLSFGNAVFVDRDFTLNDAYVQAVRQHLGAQAESLNFRNADETVARINGYIEQQTRQMIRNMIQSPPERAALVNAGYFKGAWDFKFDVRHTREEADFNTGRATKKLPLMHQREKTFLYYRGDGFQMATLAYKNGDFAMDLIVPDASRDVEAAVRKVQEQLTGENYRRWLAAEAPRKINLGLPRFETKFKQELTEHFRRVMPIAFSDAADFGNMTRERVAIDSVIHATTLKVNEEGTEGAFATVIGIRATSVVVPTIPNVIADRPFLFVIRHTATGTPLFVSTVWDPQALPRPASN